LFVAFGLAVLVWMPENSAHALDDLSRLGEDVAGRIHLPKSPASVTVSLDDSDVKGNARNDWELFRNAIAKLKSVHGSHLVIPKRVYQVRARDGITPNDAVINLADFSDLTIDGNGAEIDFVDLKVRSGIRISHSSRVLMQGLSIDWLPILAYPGTLVREADPTLGAAANYFVVDKAYPIDRDDLPEFTTLYQFDVSGRRFVESNRPTFDRMLGCPENPVRCAKYEGNQRFALPVDSAIDAIPADSPMVATLRSNNLAALLIDNGSADVTIRDLAIYSSPGSGIAVINAASGFHLQRVSITRKPDNLLSGAQQSRLISTVSDAINFISTQGDILIEDSDIGFEADDGTNIRGKMAEGRRFKDDTQKVEVSESDPSAFIPGDALDIRDATTLALIARTRIRNVQRNNNGTMQIVLAAKPEIPPDTKLFVISQRINSGNYVIRNCNFHDNKNRGILVRGGKGLITNNRISGTTSSGIQLAAEYFNSSAEGPPIDEVLVTKNLISNTNRGDYSLQSGTQKFPAAIMAYANNFRSYMGPVNENYRIQDNSITNVPGIGIFIASSRDVVVSDNTLSNIDLKSYGDPRFADVAIYVTQSENIKIQGNHFKGRVSIDATTTKNVTQAD
jgi:hypothetical protein